MHVAKPDLQLVVFSVESYEDASDQAKGRRISFWNAKTIVNEGKRKSAALAVALVLPSRRGKPRL